MRVQQPFRKFASIAAAFDAHGELLATAPVYYRARMGLPDVRKFIDGLMPVRDAKGGILKQGYATDPMYAAKVKSLIAAQGLATFDRAHFEMA